MKIYVKNNGTEIKVRAGHTFPPGEVTAAEISPRQVSEIRGCRDLEIVPEPVPVIPLRVTETVPVPDTPVQTDTAAAYPNDLQVSWPESRSRKKNRDKPDEMQGNPARDEG